VSVAPRVCAADQVLADAGAPTCGVETFELEPRPAELMLVLDRSGSMNTPAAPGAPTTKWTDVTSALDEAMMKTCFPCHQQTKARDLVFTRYAP